MSTTKSEENILVFAPTGQDAFLLSKVLGQEKMSPEIVHSEEELRDRLKKDAGALLLAEEALTQELSHTINSALGEQEPWSDIPVVLLTFGGRSQSKSAQVLKTIIPAGNVSLLERPCQPLTLLSTLRVALRARRRQYQVRELLQQQAEATRVRDEFISVAGHELKTPLTSLKLQAQLNQRLITTNLDRGATRTRMEKLVSDTERQVNRLSRLVEDMLDVSRIATGKLAMEYSETNFGDLIEELVTRTRPQLEAVGCQVNLSLEKGVIGHWDRFRVEQVISNLLTNAIRYAPGAPLWITLEKRDRDAWLSVRDEGPGIAPQNHEKIFQRFERAVNERNISGLGLGLYICREIVEAHGGAINVKSAPGEGAEFRVRLPLLNSSLVH